MNENIEKIDMKKYRRDYLEKLSKRDRKDETQEHIERAKKGVEVWNAWALKIETEINEEIEKKHGKNASDEQKLAIRNQYKIDFTGATKVNTLDVGDFAGFNFPIAVNFSGLTFSGEANFYHATFSGMANFYHATFSGEASFHTAKFSGEANFYHATFSGLAYFSSAKFSGGANFLGAKVSGLAYFTDATFSDRVNFSRVTFSDTADFKGVKFSREVDRYSTGYIKQLPKEKREKETQEHIRRAKKGLNKWNAWALRIETEIKQEIKERYPEGASDWQKQDIRNQYEIDFTAGKKVNTLDVTNFFGFHFPIRVNFNDATFSSWAVFINAKFSGIVGFINAKFSGLAHFHEATFSDKVNFSHATFSGLAIFSGVIFNGGEHQYISFQGANFTSANSFADVKFEAPKSKDTKNKVLFSMPVDFRNASFQSTPLVDSFPSDLSQFIKANKDKEQSTELIKYFYTTSEAKFRRLKRLAEADNNHLKATEFYACELYCQRRASNNYLNWKNWSNYIYSWFSGYGLSFLKPFVSWLVILVVAVVAQACVDGKEPKFFDERTTFYAAPSFSPISSINWKYQSEVRERLYPKCEAENIEKGQMPRFIQTIRFSQSILSMTMLFFMLLALRNRFKIK